MPAAFDNCRAKGGKLRTISGPNKQFGLAAGEYVHVCILGGKTFIGEKKQKKHQLRRMEAVNNKNVQDANPGGSGGAK